MDDLLHKFNEIILQTFAAESRLEEEFQKSTKKLDEHVTQSISNGTPIQSKKRPKRLESMDEGGEPADETANSTSSSLHTSRASHRKNSTQVAKGREKVRSLADEMAAVAPASLVPSVQSVVEEHSSKSHQEENERRPARAARVKATQNLKEPSLMGKLRQPSITIKKERISEELRNEQQVEPMETDGENDANAINVIHEKEKEKDKDAEKRKSNDEGFGSTNEKEKESEEPPASAEMSIILIPKPIPKVEVLSDDEDAGKMPPPMMPPPPAPKTKSTRAKKADKSKVKSSSNVLPINIKKEKDADETSSSSAISSADSTLSTTSTKSSSRNRKKKTSSAPEPKKVHIKTEKLSSEGSQKTMAANSPTQSEKSVYEDALDGDAVMRPVAVALGRMPMIADGEKNQTFAMDSNGTFSVPASNGTFSVPTSNGTFVVPSPANGTFNVVKSPENAANGTFQLPGPGNSTFVMDKPKSTEEQHRALINASIMTEDNSHVEESPEKPPPKAKKPAVAKKPQTTSSKSSKKHNELFSLQSPIKTRIEAFEKAAVGSPFHSRTAAAGKNTTPSQPPRFPSKTSTTPLASQRYPASAKAPSTQTTPTAQSTLPLSKGISSSASKLAHLQKKPTLASANLPKSQSLSREPSIERGTLSSASSTTSLALDEKKKKREEKQRLAQQQREQIEKEKRENAERLMKEKEEKHRKLVQEKEDKLRADLVKKAKKMEEFEKRRHLEELNQRMLAEQKREELAKLEQQQRSEREQAELFKINQAKENYEIKLHKQMYQQKMQQQQKLQQAQILQQQQLQLKKLKPNGTTVAAQEKNLFTFDMILTDDSTDDESTSASKKSKRPPLPVWCSKEERNPTIRTQREIKLKVIDQFFSVAPMTADLREIFPSIDARKLKRNSSAVWRTPPRYSQMPKY
ncbi:inner centromere protein [Aedes albopictus]|uniref:Inner centromere protein ARK-binding domain-containing protein n=1 Tax=Aedes albopictus TaxID=7160 RepID=A0ABM1Z0D4_AEDAL|nr:inner centromere protein-like [Aedes albopictus]